MFFTQQEPTANKDKAHIKVVKLANLVKLGSGETPTRARLKSGQATARALTKLVRPAKLDNGETPSRAKLVNEAIRKEVVLTKLPLISRYFTM